MRTDAIFQIHSMTKPVTATGIMLLMEEGKLALNDPLEKYLPEFRGLWVIESQDGKTRTLRVFAEGLSRNGACLCFLPT